MQCFPKYLFTVVTRKALLFSAMAFSINVDKNGSDELGAIFFGSDIN
jgi:hypothetical protein